jgi:hypothetical protein
VPDEFPGTPEWLICALSVIPVTGSPAARTWQGSVVRFLLHADIIATRLGRIPGRSAIALPRRSFDAVLAAAQPSRCLHLYLTPGCGHGDQTSGQAVFATTSHGTATATSCPVTAQWGTNILYVQAIDYAGNVTQYTS